MRQWMVERFQLPKGAVVNRKVPKKTFFSQGDLSTKEKELFTSQIESIYLLSIVNQQTMNVAAYVSEDMNYSEILWLHVQLREKKNANRIIDTIHKSIPNPVVILVESEEQEMSISTCHKRLNKNDTNKTVLEKIESTQWFRASEELEYIELLDRLMMSNLSYSDSYRFYDDIHVAIMFSKVIELIKLYPSRNENKEQILNLLKTIEEKNEELRNLQKEQKDHLDFGAKMEFHMQVKRKEQQVNNSLQKLKELC